MKQMWYILVVGLLLLGCTQSEVTGKAASDGNAPIELIDNYFFTDEKVPYSFAIDVGPGKVNNCHSENDRSFIPGYPMNRVLGELPFQPIDSENPKGAKCHFEFVRNPNSRSLNLSKLERFKYENCSIYFAGYPDISGGYITLNAIADENLEASPQPSPASDCYFRLAMSMQGFDRALFMKKRELFDDISRVAPFETLYSSNTRNVPILAGYMKFRCPHISNHYYSKNLRSKLVECISKKNVETDS